MENLIPLAAYDVDETGYWGRLPFLSGFFYGLFMAIFSLLYPLDDSGMLYSRTTRVLFIFLFCSVFFGIVFTYFFRRRLRSMRNRVFAETADIDEPLLVNKRLDYRFLCSLVTGSSSAIGGVMFLGPDGMIFVPHKRGRRTSAGILEMGPVTEVRITAADPPIRNFLQRILIPRPRRLLRVQWPAGCTNFLVPTIESFAPKLSELTAKLRS